MIGRREFLRGSAVALGAGLLGERIGFAREEKRKRRFRPDQVRHVFHAGSIRT